MTMLTLLMKIVHAQRSAKAVISVRPSESHEGRKPAENGLKDPSSLIVVERAKRAKPLSTLVEFTPLVTIAESVDTRV